MVSLVALQYALMIFSSETYSSYIAVSVKEKILRGLGAVKFHMHNVGGKEVLNDKLMTRQLRVAVGLPAVPVKLHLDYTVV
jgi:hypothetical protein